MYLCLEMLVVEMVKYIEQDTEFPLSEIQQMKFNKHYKLNETQMWRYIKVVKCLCVCLCVCSKVSC